MLRNQTFSKPSSILFGSEYFLEVTGLINHIAVRAFRRLAESPQYCYRAILFGNYREYPTKEKFLEAAALITSFVQIQEVFYVENSAQSFAQLQALASLCDAVYSPPNMQRPECAPFRHLFWKGPPQDFIEALDSAALTTARLDVQ